MFAVRAFFVISGFYMAMIICERYAERAPGDFYASRLLKLLPIYWCVAFLSLLIADRVPWQTVNVSAWPLPLVVSGAASLFSLLGIDLFAFVAIDPATGALSFAPYRSGDEILGLRFLPVPQAWSLGLELWFYLLAPFIVRRSIWLIGGVLVASIAARYLFFYMGYGTWEGGLPQLGSGGRWFLNRDVFPFELAYFMLGVLAYRGLMRVKPALKGRSLGAVALAFIVAVILCRAVAMVEGPDWKITAVTFATLSIGLPFIFLASKDGPIDRFLGELSYPVYIAHVLVLNALGAWASIPICVVVTLCAAVALDQAIAKPIDRFRVRFGARSREPSPAGARYRWA
jgi:peptidoglycan/LPS O-acetylase OafA/YrhL